MIFVVAALSFIAGYLISEFLSRDVVKAVQTAESDATGTVADVTKVADVAKADVVAAVADVDKKL